MRLPRAVYRAYDEVQAFIAQGRRDAVFAWNELRLNPSSALPKKITTERSVIILAAGEQTRWAGPGLKQLAQVAGVPIIEQTLSSCPEARVVSHRKRLAHLPRIVPQFRRWTVESLYSTREHWGERTIVLLGDVHYDKKDLVNILQYEGEWGMFGSPSQGEIFGFSFHRDCHKKLLKHLRRVITHAEMGGRGKLWELYRSLVGLPLHRHAYRHNFFTLSRCIDFDTYEEYQAYVHDGRIKQRFTPTRRSSISHYLGLN